MSCVNRTNSYLKDDWKMYAVLTVMQGQTSLSPNVKKNMRPLTQWVKDRISPGKYPTSDIFQIAGHNVPILIGIMTKHEQCVTGQMISPKKLS